MIDRAAEDGIDDDVHLLGEIGHCLEFDRGSCDAGSLPQTKMSFSAFLSFDHG